MEFHRDHVSLAQLLQKFYRNLLFDVDCGVFRYFRISMRATSNASTGRGNIEVGKSVQVCCVGCPRTFSAFVGARQRPCGTFSPACSILEIRLLQVHIHVATFFNISKTRTLLHCSKLNTCNICILLQNFNDISGIEILNYCNILMNFRSNR